MNFTVCFIFKFYRDLEMFILKTQRLWILRFAFSTVPKMMVVLNESILPFYFYLNLSSCSLREFLLMFIANPLPVTMPCFVSLTWVWSASPIWGVVYCFQFWRVYCIFRSRFWHLFWYRLLLQSLRCFNSCLQWVRKWIFCISSGCFFNHSALLLTLVRKWIFGYVFC